MKTNSLFVEYCGSCCGDRGVYGFCGIVLHRMLCVFVGLFSIHARAISESGDFSTLPYRTVDAFHRSTMTSYRLKTTHLKHWYKSTRVISWTRPWQYPREGRKRRRQMTRPLQLHPLWLQARPVGLPKKRRLATRDQTVQSIGRK